MNAPDQSSSYPDDWRKIARQDWRRVRILLENDDAQGAGFFLQQTLEKYHKAYLLSKGWQLKRIHTLHSLLDDVMVFDGAFVGFRPLCERVSGFYLTDRYPTLGTVGLDREDVQKELPESRHLIEALFPDEMLG